LFVCSEKQKQVFVFRPLTSQMKSLFKIEKALFYFLVFFLFLQKRLIWTPFGGEFNEWTSFYLYATDILIVAILFLWLVRVWRKEGKVNFGWTDLLLAIFLLFAGLSVITAENRWLGIYGFVKLLEFSALFFYAKNNFLVLFSWQKFWQIFICSAFLQSMVAIIQFFKQGSLGLKIFAESQLDATAAGVAKIIVGGGRLVRAYGLVPHPNILAAILVAAIFGMAYLWLINYRQLAVIKKIIYAVVFAVLSWALFLTFSRAVIVIGLALLIIRLILFCRNAQYKKSALFVLTSLFIAYSLLLIVYWPHFSTRFDIKDLGSGQAADLRAEYNKIALDLIKERPLLGVGQGNFVFVFGQYYNLLRTWLFQPVHNVYLLIAAENGILALLAFLAFLFFIIKSTLKRAKDNLAVAGCLFIIYSLLLFGLSDHFWWDLQQGQIMFWLFLGLLASEALHPVSPLDKM